MQGVWLHMVEGVHHAPISLCLTESSHHAIICNYRFPIGVLALSGSADRRQDDPAVVWGFIFGLERVHGVFPGRVAPGLCLCPFFA